MREPVTTISSTSSVGVEVGSACCATAAPLASNASHGAVLDAGVLVIICRPLSDQTFIAQHAVASLMRARACDRCGRSGLSVRTGTCACQSCLLTCTNWYV